MEDKIITDEYLSVKAFADKAGITTQRVYQLLAKDLQSYCKVIGNTKYINISALERFTTKPICKDLQEDLPSDSQTFTKALQEQIETLKQHNALLSEQVSVKDAQIANLGKSLSDTTAALTAAQNALRDTTAALTAAQALHAGTMQQQLTDKSGGSGCVPEDAAEEPKRNFWQRLFRRK